MPPLATRVYDLYFHHVHEEFQPLSSAFTGCSAASVSRDLAGMTCSLMMGGSCCAADAAIFNAWPLLVFPVRGDNAADEGSSPKLNLQPGVTRWLLVGFRIASILFLRVLFLRFFLRPDGHAAPIVYF